jgi:hypothetical protein
VIEFEGQRGCLALKGLFWNAIFWKCASGVGEIIDAKRYSVNFDENVVFSSEDRRYGVYAVMYWVTYASRPHVLTMHVFTV